MNGVELASVRRQTIVNRLDVGHDLAGFGIGLTVVVAHQEHEGLMKAGLNDAAERLSTSIPALHLESSWQNCAAVAPPNE